MPSRKYKVYKDYSNYSNFTLLFSLHIFYNNFIDVWFFSWYHMKPSDKVIWELIFSFPCNSSKIWTVTLMWKEGFIFCICSTAEHLSLNKSLDPEGSCYSPLLWLRTNATAWQQTQHTEPPQPIISQHYNTAINKINDPPINPYTYTPL